MKWTQQQAVAFESARETITDMMAILTARVYQEKRVATPNLELIRLLENEQNDLHRQRSALHVTDDVGVATVLEKYGQAIREWRARG